MIVNEMIILTKEDLRLNSINIDPHQLTLNDFCTNKERLKNSHLVLYLPDEKDMSKSVIIKGVVGNKVCSYLIKNIKIEKDFDTLAYNFIEEHFNIVAETIKIAITPSEENVIISMVQDYIRILDDIDNEQLLQTIVNNIKELEIGANANFYSKNYNDLTSLIEDIRNSKYELKYKIKIDSNNLKFWINEHQEYYLDFNVGIMLLWINMKIRSYIYGIINKGIIQGVIQ
jgi:hypothetical protein